MPLPEGTLKIGRGKGNDLMLIGRGVSRNHAQLSYEGGVVKIEDRESTYGTKVNDRLVRSSTVALGDRIEIGSFRLLTIPSTHTIQQSRGSAADVPPSKFDVGTASISTVEYSAVPRSAIGDALRRPTGPMPLHTPLPDGTAVPIVRFLPADSSSAFLQVLSELNDAAVDQTLARCERLVESLPAAGAEEAGAPNADDMRSVLQVYRAAEILARSPDLDTFFEGVLDRITRDLGATTAVLLKEDGPGRWHAVLVRHDKELQAGEVPVSSAVVDRALATGMPVISENLANDPQYGARRSVHLYRVGALLALPLRERGGTVGVLYLTREAGVQFSHGEIRTARALTWLLAKALSLKYTFMSAREREQEAKRIKQFLPPELPRELRSKENPIQTRTRLVTVLHVELDSFAELCSALPVAQLVQVVEAFRTAINDSVLNKGGTVVWLSECAGAAVFGSEGANSGDVNWAIHAATHLHREFRALLSQSDIAARCGLRQGLDTGEVELGVVGPPDRPHYAVLGAPAANAAAAARLGVPDAIRLTARTFDQLPHSDTSPPVTKLETDLGLDVYELKL